jgi:protein-histidine N-methyltransferase
LFPVLHLTCLKVQASSLPELISYSPIVIPLESGKTLTLPRRDLFDARFQLIAQGDDLEPNEDNSEAASGAAGPSALRFLDAPSDLVPGVYEGGLKTWECSLDLAAYMEAHKEALMASNVFGKRTLEVRVPIGLFKTEVG